MGLPRRAFGALVMLALLGLLAAASAHAQTVCQGSYRLESQTEVDDFAALGCTEVTGDLDIATFQSTTGEPSAAPIISIAGLAGLTSVGGYLSIRGNRSLTSLSGLDALTTVGSHLIIGNEALTSLAGLGALTSVGGRIDIEGNRSLRSLSGLDALTVHEGDLKILNNDALRSLAGLDALTAVGGTFTIQANPSLTSLDGLDTLESVGDFLSITGNRSLSSLAGLGALTAVEGGLTIRDTDFLTSLAGLGELESVGGRLTIFDNDALESLAGLDALTADVEALGDEGALNKGQVNGLTRKLVQAQRKLARGQSPAGQLGGFRQQVRDLEAEGVLTAEQADALVASVDAISGVIASPCSVEGTAGSQAVEGPETRAMTTGTPTAFALGAAYPNPLRAAATLTVTVPESAQVRVAVYDALGRTVAVLLDDAMEAGTHRARFDAVGLASGVYLVRATSDAGAVETQRLTVVR